MIQFSVNKPGTPKVMKEWCGGDTYELTSQRALAFSGPCRVEVSADDFFGGPGSKPYVGRVIVNPTWRKIAGEAIKAQRRTLDRHHSFLEDAYVARMDGDVKVIHLVLGS
jgi:hypothetical protein